jgi:hypothetical protein
MKAVLQQHPKGDYRSGTGEVDCRDIDASFSQCGNVKRRTLWKR